MCWRSLLARHLDSESLRREQACLPCHHALSLVPCLAGEMTRRKELMGLTELVSLWLSLVELLLLRMVLLMMWHRSYRGH